MSMTIEELELGFRRIDAATQCRNLMGKYQLSHLQSRHKEYMDMWADRDDDILEMPWGAYYGKAAVVECYTHDHPDRSDPDFIDAACPFHHASTEVIEVAEDCMTAKSVWMSQGNESGTVPSDEDKQKMKDFGMDMGDVEEHMARWSWCRYATDFIFENGVWKIWRMRLIATFQNEYYDDICDEVVENTATGEGGETEDIEPWWSYRKTSYFPADRPEPPLPYKTYADVGWGQGKHPFAL